MSFRGSLLNQFGLADYEINREVYQATAQVITRYILYSVLQQFQLYFGTATRTTPSNNHKQCIDRWPAVLVAYLQKNLYEFFAT